MAMSRQLRARSKRDELTARFVWFAIGGNLVGHPVLWHVRRLPSGPADGGGHPVEMEQEGISATSQGSACTRWSCRRG